MEAMIAGLVQRSTASGWVLCLLGVAGVIQLTRIIALQRPKMRELDIGENATIRQEYIDEMRALRVEITELRDENKSLRKEVGELHGIIDGMRREALAAGLSTQRAVIDALPDSLVPAATRAALNKIKGVGE